MVNARVVIVFCPKSAPLGTSDACIQRMSAYAEGKDGLSRKLGRYDEMKTYIRAALLGVMEDIGVLE